MFVDLDVPTEYKGCCGVGHVFVTVSPFALKKFLLNYRFIIRIEEVSSEFSHSYLVAAAITVRAKSPIICICPRGKKEVTGRQ